MIDYERYVLEALQKAVIAANASVSVKYVGRTMATPSNGKWLEVVYIPNNLGREFWSEGKTYQGIMRLILHWPMNDEGPYSALDVLKAVADKFPLGSNFNDTGNNVIVRIVDHPNVSNVLEEPPNLLIPLTIKYACFKV